VRRLLITSNSLSEKEKRGIRTSIWPSMPSKKNLVEREREKGVERSCTSTDWVEESSLSVRPREKGEGNEKLP